MKILNIILKELRTVNYEFFCLMQLLNDLENTYPMDRYQQTHSFVHLLKSWLQKQEKHINNIADTIDNELILLYQKDQKN